MTPCSISYTVGVVMKLKDKSPSLKNKINNTSIQTNKNFILNILHLNNKGYDKVLNINN